jgi:hypothetical protein
MSSFGLQYARGVRAGWLTSEVVVRTGSDRGCCCKARGACPTRVGSATASDGHQSSHARTDGVAVCPYSDLRRLFPRNRVHRNRTGQTVIAQETAAHAPPNARSFKAPSHPPRTPNLGHSALDFDSCPHSVSPLTSRPPPTDKQPQQWHPRRASMASCPSRCCRRAPLHLHPAVPKLRSHA